ncbi:MAG: hypothetical protein K2Y08_03720 [Alphaproteobacteria bacterium]|nr:hypothetical protein [Alphaproteobacteria bacterium]
MVGHSKDNKQKTTKLQRIGTRTELKKDTVFNNLGHADDVNFLRESYHQLDARKVVGCDGVTKEAYRERLEENLRDLLARIRRGAYRPKPSRLVGNTEGGGSVF